jgi:Lrp/AsnC family leucine-responsive transcriptional regulator
MRLDAKDRALITLLVARARTSNRELAQHVGLSPSACLARVRRLEERRIIVGYRAVVAHGGAGGRIEGLADIRFADPSPGEIDRFVDLLKSAPEIVEAHRIAGNHDYMVRFCAGDMAAWNTFRQSVERIGCTVQMRLSILVEPLI